MVKARKLSVSSVRGWALTLTAVAAAAILASCAQSPTGRSQLQLLSSSQLDQMGDKSYREMKAQEKVSKDAKVNAYVQCIADALIAELPAPYAEQPWEVNVFVSDQVNAFALPGGHIGVYQGLLKVAETPAQLAAVMGHEIGHVIAGHSNERLSTNMVAGLGLEVAGAYIAGNTDNNTAGLIMAGLGLGTQVGVILPFSRTHESEADALGLDYMAAAGFDPAAAADLWRNMAAQGGKAPLEFLSTHPSPQSRINAIEKRLPEVTPIYQRRQQQGDLPNCRRP